MVPPAKKPAPGAPVRPEGGGASEEMGPHKLIRPSLANIMRDQGSPRPASSARRVAPPE